MIGARRRTANRGEPPTSGRLGGRSSPPGLNSRRHDTCFLRGSRGQTGRGGIRTRTQDYLEGILSPQRLPFRHSPVGTPRASRPYSAARPRGLYSSRPSSSRSPCPPRPAGPAWRTTASGRGPSNERCRPAKAGKPRSPPWPQLVETATGVDTCKVRGILAAVGSSNEARA